MNNRELKEEDSIPGEYLAGIRLGIGEQCEEIILVVKPTKNVRMIVFTILFALLSSSRPGVGDQPGARELHVAF